MQLWLRTLRVQEAKEVSLGVTGICSSATMGLSVAQRKAALPTLALLRQRPIPSRCWIALAIACAVPALFAPGHAEGCTA